MADSILIVDDDPNIPRTVGAYFERLGFEVLREGTGEGGVELSGRTVRRHGGNRTRAAEELGISRATLINKIEAHALAI